MTLPCINIQCLLITFYMHFGILTAALYCTVFIICYAYFYIKQPDALCKCMSVCYVCMHVLKLV